MFPKVKNVEILGTHELRVEFIDGASGILDFAEAFGFKGVFEKLRDSKRFARVRVSRDWKTLAWRGGIDVDPIVLYSKVTGKSVKAILTMPDPVATHLRSPHDRRKIVQNLHTN